MMEQCPHGNSVPDEVIARLGPSQAGEARHKCAVCAYTLGTAYSGNAQTVEQCGRGNVAPKELLAALPDYQGGRTRHLCATCGFTEGVANGAAHSAMEVENNLAEDEAQEEHGSIEGTPSLRLHRTYERDRQNRAKAIVYHGNKCAGCGFSFDDTYTPDHANGYIEIHHIRPLSSGPQLIDPRHDLVPLCANCHRMVHRHAGEWLDLVQLQLLIERAGGSFRYE